MNDGGRRKFKEGMMPEFHL